MRKAIRRALFLLALTMLFAGQVLAQGTISEINNGSTASFVRPTSAFDDSPAANFIGVSPITTQDHIFETGWWYRVQTATQESFMPVPTTQNYSGNTSLNTWTGFAFGFFTTPLNATETGIVTNAKVTPASVEGGSMILELEVQNPNTGPVTIDVFHMLDMDVQPSAGDDQAVLVGGQPYVIRIFDAGTNRGIYASNDADGYLVRPFGATDVAAVLSNTAVDNFENTGLPFSAGDFSAGMHWTNRVIPAGGSAVFTVVFGINAEAVFDPVILNTNLFTNGFESKRFFAYDFGAQQLVSFDPDNLQAVRVIPVTGLGQENVLGLAFRPRDKRLFSVGNLASSNARFLYEINPANGAATPIGTVNLPMVTGTAGGIGMGFDPVQDRLRLVASNVLNRRINPDTGGLTSTNPNLTWAAGDVNAGGGPPQVYHIAYTNSKAFATTTRLIGITETLVVVEINAATGVASTIGSLPPEFDPINIGGFDIDADNELAYLMYNNHVYRFNLNDFIVTDLGIIGGALNAVNLLDGLTILQ
ncbi:hypothetical protein C7S18_15835 [Ahniella affigens]|uniref:DUF4394 domain-containing protein n=2 Tax=Ahniella affigens TaxID=2021234 RepID=A0A2P1PUN5_9GAMM|nr:hypothetical protein C7S18_15835 [Ahniella affigens]